MKWVNLLHFYQPFWQKREILEKVVKESYQPILKILKENKKVKITFNICGSLTEILIKFGFKEILNEFKKIALKGQIEFTGSAVYHPILPLLPKEEVIRQIKLNEKINKKIFGKIWQPKGFFLPEMAYDKKTAKIIKSLNYQWLILDEIAYNGKIGKVNFTKVYQIKNLKMNVVFRNRGLSDIFYTGWLDSEEKFYQALKNDKRSDEFLITAFDAENLGHHKPGSEKIFENLVKKIETMSISEFIEKIKEKEIVEPIPSSWSTREIEIKQKIPYPLWFHPQNKIHQLQWQLTYLIIRKINRFKKDKKFKEARELLDRALNSCQYWWASAMPWWSFKIIEENAENFVKIFKILEKKDLKLIKTAEKIKEKIIFMAKKWQDLGLVEKIKNDYLKGEPVRYFGGKIV
jgi:alpha-amylase/alpha-mannosidase (GH57 family)